MHEERRQVIKNNLDRVRGRIAQACRRCGRDPAAITLVAVTKSVEPDIAGFLLEAGAVHVGENRVKEAERKQRALGEVGHWHMIGHLQRNKVKKALPLFATIHSVDSIRLLRELSAQCAKLKRTVEIFLEVNVSGEEAKYGLQPAALEETLIEAASLPGLALRGLMTMAPYDPDPEQARPHFRALKRLLDEVGGQREIPAACRALSMGMSGDFEVAVEEGATHLRIGTALFEGLV